MIPGVPKLPEATAEVVEIEIKFSSYIERQQRQVAQFRELEDLPIPLSIDYDAIKGLRSEAGDRLKAVRPLSVGQAARLPGVSRGCFSVGHLCSFPCRGSTQQGAVQERPRVRLGQ